MGYRFDLALLVPGRACIERWLRRQRIGAKTVGLVRTLQAIQFDEAPQAERRCSEGKRQVGGRIWKPVGELVVEAGSCEERHHPPAALVAVMQPLDGEREINPRQ